MPNLIRFLFVSFLFVTSFAHAGLAYNSVYAAPPDAGQYWNPQEPGNGYGIDIDSKGNVFVQWFTYRADGVPVWYTMSGTIERAPAQTLGRFGQVPACTTVPFLERCLGDKIRFFKTGVLARVTSPVYAVVNGACPTCPPRFPDVSQSALGPATIEWVGNRAAVLTFQGRSISIQRQDIATPMRELIANKSFTGFINSVGTAAGSSQILNYSYPVTARFFASTGITGISSVSVKGVPTLNLSSLNIQAPTSFIYASSFVNNGILELPAETDRLVVVDEKNNRAYILNGTIYFGSFEFKVNSYCELFIYDDRMVCWKRSPFTNSEVQETGIPLASFEMILEPVTPAAQVVIIQ